MAQWNILLNDKQCSVQMKILLLADPGLCHAGQGNLIYQCMPNGSSPVWANVTISGACKKDNAGVGVTMALTRCGSVIIVGSLPIRPGGLLSA